ncbi:MAG: DUF4342 domain-containing protein [Desulfurispora sp.]|uniref:DUF4342 domain-containing protein n=1 Tax=Desulfurispora sp. TaxID=3014275 RepID=UPI0040493E55
MDELQKIDAIRSRTGVSYRQAREALAAVGGDVVQALIYLEENRIEPEGEAESELRSRGRELAEKVQQRSQELVGQLKGMVARSQETKIKIKQGDKTVLEVPAAVGALGVLGALASSELAILAALGGMTALAKKYSLEIDRPGEKNDLVSGQDDF